MVVEVTKENFEKEVIHSEVPVIIDFWSQSCRPCKMLAPVFEEISSSYKGKLKFAKMNAQENLDIAAKFGIMTLPTLVLINKGKEVDKAFGFAPAGVLKTKIDIMMERLQARKT